MKTMWMSLARCSSLALCVSLSPPVWAEHHGHHAVTTAAPASAASAKAAARVQVMDAWIRPAVKGQSGTGGFMRLTAVDGATLVGFASPVAGTAELHEMKMEGDVMKMRPISALALPAGQAVELKPGGHHLMLMNLKTSLKAGAQVSLTLKFKDPAGKPFRQTIKVPVMSAGQAPAAASGPMHHAH
ncbi:MAG TPA: copper chaperone PCu(A)C [Aquabacterium sp.]|uniref:copper chaperone PCu(A)C n=1 Tax=Aquabacterium sp. TaxID=1872578 RepID=UPI002E2FB12E|nr:copper chaperone PCu(A)C [Aquabacterium sp.]HEX5373642.1 copper chaperone PCu(A)C [Aquabacterium sp.]